MTRRRLQLLCRQIATPLVVLATVLMFGAAVCSAQFDPVGDPQLSSPQANPTAQAAGSTRLPMQRVPQIPDANARGVIFELRSDPLLAHMLKQVPQSRQGRRGDILAGIASSVVSE